MSEKTAGIPEIAFKNDIVVIADTSHKYMPWVGLFPENIEYFSENNVTAVMLELSSEKQNMIEEYYSGEITRESLESFFTAVAQVQTPDQDFNKKFGESIVDGIDLARERGITFHFVNDINYRSDNPDIYTEQAMEDLRTESSLSLCFAEKEDWFNSLSVERQEALKALKAQLITDRTDYDTDQKIAENIDEVMKKTEGVGLLIIGRGHVKSSDDLDEILNRNGYSTHVHELYSSNWRKIYSEPSGFSFKFAPDEKPDSKSILIKGDDRIPDYDFIDDEPNSCRLIETPPKI